MSHHRKHRMPPQLILITLALAAAVVLTAIAGTRAWLYYHRELGTMTKIHFSKLELTGTGTDTVPINLGEINMKERSKEMPFRVIANAGTKYILQIGHTTNLPLTYQIFTLDSNGNQKESVTLNRITTQTYSDGEDVQQNAHPEYLQSDARVCSAKGMDDYVLVVSWTIDENATMSEITDKDTEMIYLTAGIGGYDTNETTETTQATP